jgi:hypothetical protein
VVMNHVADVGEIEALISGGFEHCEVSVVGELFVRYVKNGAGDGMRGVSREQAHCPFIGIAGFEHQAGAGGAATINVDDSADVLGPEMLIDEDPRADHAGFLAVINEKNYGVPGLRERFANAGDFEDGCGAGAVVKSAGTGGDGIVVRCEQNCRAGLRAVEARQDILDRAAVALFVAGESGLDCWRVPGGGELIEDAAADYIVLRASGGMRDAVAHEAIENFTGARGGKFSGRDRGWLRCRRAQAFE